MSLEFRTVTCCPTVTSEPVAAKIRRLAGHRKLGFYLKSLKLVCPLTSRNRRYLSLIVSRIRCPNSVYRGRRLCKLNYRVQQQRSNCHPESSNYEVWQRMRNSGKGNDVCRYSSLVPSDDCPRTEFQRTLESLRLLPYSVGQLAGAMNSVLIRVTYPIPGLEWYSNCNMFAQSSNTVGKCQPLVAFPSDLTSPPWPPLHRAGSSLWPPQRRRMPGS